MEVSTVFQLIKKDILFNWKWALLLVLVAVLMPVLFFIDREETRFILWVYIILTANIIISRKKT